MKVKLRDFQHRAAMFIKELEKEEIILTQYNLPVAKVTSVDTKITFKNRSEISIDGKDENKLEGSHTDGMIDPKEKAWKEITRCEFQACRKDSIGNFKISTYSTDTGDAAITKNLCKLHKHLVSKEGTVTEV